MKDRYYKKRWYDGECEFVCGNCKGRLIEYLFDGEDISNPQTPAEIFFEMQVPPICPHCNNLSYINFINQGWRGYGDHSNDKYQMSWTGWTSDTDKADSVVGALTLLLKEEHYMAACMVLSSATEYYLNSLLYATLIDQGFAEEEANQMADGDRYNGEIVRTLRVLLKKRLKSFTLPYRNDIIHGKEFGNDKEYFKNVFINNLKHIETWVKSFDFEYNGFNPSETERWFLYMSYFTNYLKRQLS